MYKLRLPMLTLCVTFIACGGAAAQERGQVGVTMMYPEAVGVIWHASDRVAIRPEVSFNTARYAQGASTSDSWSVTAGVSGLFYARRWNDLRAYVSPRFTYGKTRSSSADAATFASASLSFESASTTSVYVSSASLGAQYALSEMFSLFAEAGPTYTRINSSSTFSPGGIQTTNARSYSWGVRTVVGATIYF